MTIAEYIFELKNGKEIIMPVKDSLILIAHIAEYERMLVRVIVNYEMGKMKLVNIP